MPSKRQKDFAENCSDKLKIFKSQYNNFQMDKKLMGQFKEENQKDTISF